MKRIQPADFENEVLKSEKPVILDCYADWCGYCKAMMPVYAQMEEIYGDKVTFLTINYDDDNAFCDETLSIITIPQFFFYKNGELLSRNGSISGDEFREKIETLLL